MRKAILLYCLLTTLAGCSLFRPGGRSYGWPVYYRELDLMPHYDQLKLHRQRSIRLEPDTVVRIRLLDRKGRSRVRIFKGKVLVCQWFYANGGEPQSEPSQLFDRQQHDYVDVIDHYIPLRDSIWRYYSPVDGHPTRIVVWNKDTLVSEQVLR